MKKAGIFLWLFIFATTSSLFGQTDRSVDEELEAILENVELDEDRQTIQDLWIQGKQQRLSINHASCDDLLNLHVLSATECTLVINHREHYGAYQSIYELQQLGIELDKLILLKHFIKLDRFENDLVHNSHKHEIQVLFEPKLNSNGMGNAIRNVIRVKSILHRQISVYLTTEKDAGEVIAIRNNQLGYDYLSGGIIYLGKHHLRKVILGDYRASFGQGLVVGSGFGASKSSLVLNIKQVSSGMTPYRSVQESGYFRGLSTAWRLGKTEIHTGLSSSKLDAQLYTDDDSASFYFQSIQQNGYHRTNKELANRKRVTANSALILVKQQLAQTTLSYQAIIESFDYAFQPKKSSVGIHEWHGKSYVKQGFAYQTILGSALCFGEMAFDDRSKLALVNGCLLSVNKGVNLAFLHRWYAPGFNAMHAHAFSEKSSIGNESGIYFGVEAKLRGGWKYHGYCDVFKHPWLTNEPVFGADGNGFMMEIRKDKRKLGHLYFRYTSETKEGGPNDVFPQKKLRKVGLHRFRIDHVRHLNSSIRLHMRLELSGYDGPTESMERGALFLQDLVVKLHQNRIKCIGRITFYNTPSFNSRIYVYENDVPSSYSIPFFYHQGWNMYVLLSAKITKNLTLWCRFAFDQQQNVLEAGSIDVTNDLKFKCMVRIQI
ncbi:MAG: hypothetical protein ACI8ZN_000354 [Bacteroidia bacterium]|jgi:hypothetical protein